MLKQPMVILCLFALSAIFAQGGARPPVIDVCDKTYEITGDFMTIIIARNIAYGEPETLAPKVIRQIKRRYEEKVDSLMARRDELNLSEKTLLDSLARLKTELRVAETQAAQLARDFAAVDLKTTSYLYQLAYYFFGNGQLVEALEVMSDKALAAIELNQAKKYILKAAALRQTGDMQESTNILKTAFERYPCFDSALAYGRQLAETGAERNNGIRKLGAAIELAGSPGERSTGYLYLAKAHLGGEDVSAAHRAAQEVILLNKAHKLNNKQEVTKARSILEIPVPTTIEKADKYLREGDLVRFDELMETHQVKNHQSPFSLEAYQLKLLYVERLRIDNPAAARKEARLIRKFLKTKQDR